MRTLEKAEVSNIVNLPSDKCSNPYTKYTSINTASHAGRFIRLLKELPDRRTLSRGTFRANCELLMIYRSLGELNDVDLIIYWPCCAPPDFPTYERLNRCRLVKRNWFIVTTRRMSGVNTLFMEIKRVLCRGSPVGKNNGIGNRLLSGHIVTSYKIVSL